MFDRIVVRNRARAFFAVFALWLVGIFVALPGQFIALVLADLYVASETLSVALLLSVPLHAIALLLGPFLVSSHVPHWVLRLAKRSLRSPLAEDAAITSMIETVAAATGRSTPRTLILRDPSANASALRINGDHVLLVTSGANDLRPVEREALVALALSRTTEANGYLTALQNWVLAPIVAARLVPPRVWTALVCLVVVTVVVMRQAGVVPNAVPIFLCALFPVKMLLLSHVVIRRGFEVHVMRSVVLSQDAAAVSLFRFPSAFRSLFVRTADASVHRAGRRSSAVLRLPIWVLPASNNEGPGPLNKRLAQLDRIDPLGAAAQRQAEVTDAA